MNYQKKMNNPITKKKSKYGNKKVIYKGIKFDSIKECKRYKNLELMEDIGLIKKLERQVKFELQPAFEINGKKVRAINYICDFTYFKTYNKNGIKISKFIVEDVKGHKTQLYELKKKMFEYKYNYEINEV